MASTRYFLLTLDEIYKKIPTYNGLAGSLMEFAINFIIESILLHTLGHSSEKIMKDESKLRHVQRRALSHLPRNTVANNVHFFVREMAFVLLCSTVLLNVKKVQVQ